jgi:hypothetical protein
VIENREGIIAGDVVESELKKGGRHDYESAFIEHIRSVLAVTHAPGNVIGLCELPVFDCLEGFLV